MNFKNKKFFIFVFFVIFGLITWLVVDYNYDLNKKEKLIELKSNSGLIENNSGTTLKTNQKELVDAILADLTKNVESYTIQKGDTMSKIANVAGLKKFEDLILINKLMGVEFEYMNKNLNSVKLTIGYKMYVPKYGSVGLIYNKLDELKQLEYTLELNNKISGNGNLDLDSIGENLYPNMVKGMGVEKMLGGFIKAQQAEFDPDLPRIVDVKWQTLVSCANLIRTLLAYSVDKEKLTETEKKFFQTQGLDAWILPDAFKEIGYTQKFNLMNNFDEYYVGGPDPVPKANVENYNKDIIKLGKYLETDGKVGSILPLYFRYSDYTKTVAKFNKNRTEKHYNTHQSLLAGIDSITFEARNVGKVASTRITNFDDLKPREMTIFDFLTNFVQQRGDYGEGALMDSTKKLVHANLHTFSSLINIKVNGDKINLEEEFKKSDADMLKIYPSDRIELYGPLMIDGLHMLSSKNPERRKNMNARTRFYFEFIIIGKFLPSELLEPGKKSLGIGAKREDMLANLDVIGVYSVKSGELVEQAIKNSVLKYEKSVFKDLDKEASDYNKKYENLLNYYYGQQIRALKIAGYMQSENNINPGAFNINAPIPYFDTKNINEIFGNYVIEMNKKVTKGGNDLYSLKNFLQVTTFPLDSYKTILNRIDGELKVHLDDGSNGLTNLKLLSEFNELQQRKFLDLFISKSKKSKSLISTDILNGKIIEGKTMVLSLKDIDKIIGDIAMESHTDNLSLTSADEFAIDLVLNLNQNKNIIENVLYIESYIPVGSYGARRGLKQFLENNSFLQFRVNIFGLKLSSEISSFGDFQLRFTSLYKGLNEEGLNRDTILKAFSYLDSKEFKDYVNSQNDDVKERVKSDLEIVDDITLLILDYENVDEETKNEYRLDIISKLEKIVVLDDGSGNNIVGKVVGASLLNEKINLHFQKLNGILQSAGESLSDVYNDNAKIQSYENTIIMINNLGELKLVYGLAENYVIRCLDSISSVLGKSYTYPSLDTTKALGQFVYGKNTFLEHMEIYKKILGNMKEDLDKKYQANTKEYLFVSTFISNMEIIVNRFLDKNNEKSTIENIYILFKSNSIKDSLTKIDTGKNKGITSILPLYTEFSGNSFRDIFFRYINTRDIERKPPKGD